MSFADKSFENALTFLHAYNDVRQGPHVYPRGTVCRERTDCRLVLEMEGSPLTSFKARNLNLKYAKEEFLWYLRADKFDQSIEAHASLWKKIRQPDGSYYSNYGQYLFPKQFNFIIDELILDQWSRRASMMLLKAEHLFHENSDVVCTYAMNFSIRDRKLHMRVHMRSNDIIFGLTNDVFCFSMIYRMVFAILKERHIWLMPGVYTHLVDSLHVYDRHFQMIDEICRDWVKGYEYATIPWPTGTEAVLSAQGKGLDGDGYWSDWLRS